ncbi:hypothetical protein HYH03_017012, partial [Edaphochlamys debaryana]
QPAPTIALCDLLAETLNGYSDTYDYPTSSPFMCVTPVVLEQNITACGYFATEAQGLEFGEFLRVGNADTEVNGFELLARDLNFQNGLKPDGSGGLACDPSNFWAYLETELTKESCSEWYYEQGCASIPVPINNFPYCKCDIGAIQKTPYEVYFKRSFVEGKNTHFCFGINVNQDQCAGSSCCSMNLEKIEFLSDHTKCLSSVDGYSVSTKNNGGLRSAVWSRNNDTSVNNGTVFGVLRANLLSLNLVSAPKAEVCIALRLDSACPNMETFCNLGKEANACQYAVFDQKKNCCASDWTAGPFTSPTPVNGTRRFRTALL